MYLATLKFYSFVLFSTLALEHPGFCLTIKIFIKDAPSSIDTYKKLFISYSTVSVFPSSGVSSVFGDYCELVFKASAKQQTGKNGGT